MKCSLLILLIFFTVSGFAQSYKVDYEENGFKGYIQFQIKKSNYIFKDGFSYEIIDNVKNVVTSYKNGQYNDVLSGAGITFPLTLDVSTANNTVDLTGNAYFYLSPKKTTQHSSQPTVHLSLFDPFPGIPDFSSDAKEYVKRYAEEQNVNLWKATGGLKNLEVTFVMLVDIKNKVEAAIREHDELEKTKEAAAQVAAQEATAEEEQTSSVTTNSKTWTTAGTEGEAKDEASVQHSFEKDVLEPMRQREYEIEQQAVNTRAAVDATADVVMGMAQMDANFELSYHLFLIDDLHLTVHGVTFGWRSKGNLFAGFDLGLNYAEFGTYIDGQRGITNDTGFGFLFGVPIGYRIPFNDELSSSEGSFFLGVMGNMGMSFGDYIEPAFYSYGGYVGINAMHLTFQVGYGYLHDFGGDIANVAKEGRENGGQAPMTFIRFGIAW